MADQNLAQKENHFAGWQETFDAAMDIFAVISKDFEIVKINKAGYESIGKKLDEIIGMKCYKVVHGLDAPIENCPCKKMLDTGSGEAAEVVDRDKIYLATAAPIFDENKKFMAFAHTVKDITNVKQTEKSLKELLDSMEIEVENRTKELFNINKKLSKEIEEHKKSQLALKRSELMLKKQKVSLKQKNDALREVITQIETEKKNLRKKIICNVDLILSPILERIKIESEADKYVDLIRHHLKEILSPYGIKLEKISQKLTIRELEICNMVKANLSSKEIARLLNISTNTVNKHRRNIRQKLGIVKTNDNLTLFLKTN